MRYLCVLILLCGCSQTMYLYERGPTGKPPVQGVLSTGGSTMSVTLDGEEYAGSFKRGASSGIAFGTTGGSAVGAGFSNQYAGLLVSPSNKTLRCEFRGGVGETGNGVCQHGDGRVFDLLLKP